MRGISCQQIMDAAHQQRTLATARLYDQPATTLQRLFEILPKDGQCKYQLGSNLDLHSREFMCPQCQHMNRLVDVKTMGLGRPFRLIDSRPCVLMKIGPAHATGVNEGVTSLLVKALGKEAIISSEALTHSVSIQWLLDDYLTRQGLPHIQKLHTAFICGDSGYGLYESPDLGSFSSFQDDAKIASATARADLRAPLSALVARSLVVQLLATLHALSPLKFTHGQSGVGALLFSRDAADYAYDGYRVRGPMTLKMSCLGQTSCLIPTKNVRMCCLKPEDMCCLENLPCNYNFGSGVGVYHLNKVMTGILIALHHAGVPMFGSSFDAYVFMTGLMSELTFYTTVQQNIELKQLWQAMWVPEELAGLDRRLQEIHNRTEMRPLTTEQVARLFRGMTLQVEIVSKLWSLIKTWT